MNVCAPSVLHLVASSMPDEWRRYRLRGFFEHEAEEGDWWACLQLQNGEIIARCGSGTYVPAGDRRQWAVDACQVMNRNSHYNGVWSVVWFKGDRRFAFTWKDPDGDIQIFGDEKNLPWRQVHLVSMHHWAEHADTMCQEWADTIHQLALDPAAQYKLAQGQRPPANPFIPSLQQPVHKLLEDYAHF